MRRVLLLSYLFPPSANVGGRRVLRMARHLPALGFETEVLTAVDSDGELPREPLQLPSTLRVHRLPVRFLMGRNPWRIPPNRPRSAWLWWKLRAYLQLARNPIDWYEPWARDAGSHLRALQRERPFDAVVASGPPFSPLVEGARVARELRIPFIADFRDLWAVSARMENARDPLGRRPAARIERLERSIVECADLVILNNAAACDAMRAEYPTLDSERFASLTNSYEEPATPPHATPQPGDRPLVIAHTGLLSYGRVAVTARLLRVAAERQSRADVPPVHFVFSGAMPNVDITALAREVGAAHLVQQLGWLGHDDCIRLQDDADILLLLQSGSPAGRLAVPAKLFEYMARRKTILAVVPADGPAARIIAEQGLGQVGACDDDDSVATALAGAIASARAGEAPPLPERYSVEATMSALATMLEGVIARRRAGAGTTSITRDQEQ